MSKSGKLYFINLDTYKSLSAQVSKLPKQQQQILATMAEHCVDTGMRGSDIVDLAKKAGLETRQKSTVLYAWYARSNEAFGVSTNPPNPIEIPHNEPSPSEATEQAETKRGKRG